jgi:hypothetical protein
LVIFEGGQLYCVSNVDSWRMLSESIYITVVLLFLSGCCSLKKSNEDAATSFSLCKKIEAVYFSSLLQSTSSASSSSDMCKEIDVTEQLKEIQKDYTVESKINVFNNSFESHYKSSNFSSGEIICQYLGNYNGMGIVVTTQRPGGSGVFSSLHLYSVNNEKLVIHKSVQLGDRGCDSWLSNPIFDGNGKIYFYSYVSNYTILSQAGLDKKIADSEGFTPAVGYGIIGKCVYDIKKDEKKVLSITVFSAENGNEKIKSLILPKMYKGIGFFDENETKKFFSDLHKLYETQHR